jgi:hypothetical protein
VDLVVPALTLQYPRLFSKDRASSVRIGLERVMGRGLREDNLGNKAKEHNGRFIAGEK